MKITINIIGEAVTVEIETEKLTSVEHEVITSEEPIDTNPISAVSRVTPDEGFNYHYKIDSPMRIYRDDLPEIFGESDNRLYIDFIVRSVSNKNKKQLLVCEDLPAPRWPAKKMWHYEFVVHPDTTITVATEIDMLELIQ